MTSVPEGIGDTIPAVLAYTAQHRENQPAIDDGTGSLTYGELLAQARSWGAALVEAGVARGDRVALWAPNSRRWIVSVLGLWYAGAVIVPVNTRFKGPEAALILGRSGAKVLVAATDFLGADYVSMLRSTGADLPQLGTIVVVSGDTPTGTESWDTFLSGAGTSALAEVDRRRSELTPDDPCDVLFTSGTTGIPKGVVMTHSRTLCVAKDWVTMAGLQAGDRYLMVNPYFHMFGLKSGILASVCAGAEMLPEPVFDVDRVLQRVQEKKVTVLPGPPTLYQSILDHPRVTEYDLSSLRVAVTGSADIPVELIRRIHEELPFSKIVSGYGLTEGGTATGTEPGDELEAIATTVGRPRPGFEVKLVDRDGEVVPDGESGEVVIRGGSVMSHYLDDPEATAANLSPDGWLKTGDLGTFDGAGRLRIVGRVKDMFIVGGFNAYPAEIENSLLRHPDIRQAAVIGIPDARMGEVGMAFVVLGPGTTETEQDIIAWSRDQMANYKVPRKVRVVDTLPLNATGKVQKEILREQAATEIP